MTGVKQHVTVFAKSIVVSAIVFAIELAGIVLLEAARVPAAVSFAVVQIAGTCVSFSLNKYWAYGAANTHAGVREGGRTLAVSAGSFVLNIVLPSLAYAHQVPATVAFTGSQILVGLVWTFPLNRFWVFDAALSQRA